MIPEKGKESGAGTQGVQLKRDVTQTQKPDEKPDGNPDEKPDEKPNKKPTPGKALEKATQAAKSPNRLEAK